jgi:hypothetical protein
MAKPVVTSWIAEVSCSFGLAACYLENALENARRPFFANEQHPIERTPCHRVSRLERSPIVRRTIYTTIHPKVKCYHRVQRFFIKEKLSSKVKCRHDLLNRAGLLRLGYTIVSCNSRSGTDGFRQLPELGSVRGNWT